jgi:hypothetical protein
MADYTDSNGIQDPYEGWIPFSPGKYFCHTALPSLPCPDINQDLSPLPQLTFGFECEMRLKIYSNIGSE